MRLKLQPNAADQDIPLRFIAFLAADEERLSHMVALTGLSENDFTTRAADPQFQAFVMDYAMENETLLLEFAARENLKPEVIVKARRALPGATF